MCFTEEAVRTDGALCGYEATETTSKSPVNGKFLN
jgi:hypothetical protein